MKKAVYIILLLFITPIFCWGQTIVYPGTGIPSGLNSFKGGLKIDSVLILPHSSGINNWYGVYGDIRINSVTGSLEYHKNGQWIEVGTSSNNYYQTKEERPGLPVGAGNHYVLTHYPVANTVSVDVNGVDIPNDWFLIVNNDLTILHAFYEIDSTDTITVKYSYHN